MRLIVHDVEQGSEAWLRLRLGRVTSSGAANVLPLSALDPKKGDRDNETSRLDYLLMLACERRTGRPGSDGFKSSAMERGTRVEPQALERYRLAHPEYDVRTVGFLADEGGLLGDSPDGVVYDGDTLLGGVELKCPLAPAHWKYRETGGVPREYLRQMLHHLYVTGAAWWDFASYHPEFEEPVCWYEYRMTREAAAPMLAIYDAALGRFLADVEEKVAIMRDWALTSPTAPLILRGEE